VRARRLRARRRRRRYGRRRRRRAPSCCARIASAPGGDCCRGVGEALTVCCFNRQRPLLRGMKERSHRADTRRPGAGLRRFLERAEAGIAAVDGREGWGYRP
jgi:hypothetical protein